jgi:hypothetical protein
MLLRLGRILGRVEGASRMTSPGSSQAQASGAVSPALGAGGGVSGTAPAVSKVFRLYVRGSHYSLFKVVYPVELDMSFVTAPPFGFAGVWEEETKWFKVKFEVVEFSEDPDRFSREFWFTDVYHPIILYHYGNHPKPYKRAYLVTKEEGTIKIVELPVKEEKVEDDIAIYEVSYVEYEGRKVVCEKREVYRKKPRVWITTILNEVVVKGDTYKVKDVIKRLGFRWNPSTKVWVAPVDKIDIETVRKELEKVADVVVK